VDALSGTAMWHIIDYYPVLSVVDISWLGPRFFTLSSVKLCLEFRI